MLSGRVAVLRGCAALLRIWQRRAELCLDDCGVVPLLWKTLDCSQGGKAFDAAIANFPCFLPTRSGLYQLACHKAARATHGILESKARENRACDWSQALGFEACGWSQLQALPGRGWRKVMLAAGAEDSVRLDRSWLLKTV